jgi:hypothetical protein
LRTFTLKLEPSTTELIRVAQAISQENNAYSYEIVDDALIIECKSYKAFSWLVMAISSFLAVQCLVILGTISAAENLQTDITTMPNKENYEY